MDFVDDLDASGTTNYTKAFNVAFDILDAFEGDRCHSTILFVTDGDDDITTIANDFEYKNIDENYIVLSYGFGSDANLMVAKEMAELTNGVFKIIYDEDNDKFNNGNTKDLSMELMLFYLYYAYTGDVNQHHNDDNIKITSPYLDFDTGFPMITISKPIYYQSYLIGVVGIDIPLSYLSLAIGDITIGRKSYYFVMNQQSELILHPNIVNDIRVNITSSLTDDSTNEYVPVYATDMEPMEFYTSSDDNETILHKMMTTNWISTNLCSCPSNCG